MFFIVVLFYFQLDSGNRSTLQLVHPAFQVFHLGFKGCYSSIEFCIGEFKRDNIS
jgi:hypothetical protein